MLKVIPESKELFNLYIDKWYNPAFGMIEKGGEWFIDPESNQKVLKELGDDMRIHGVNVKLREVAGSKGLSLFVEQ